jgi:hypothetical protein
MNNKVVVLVACHKPAEVYSDDVYTPIHVGRAISSCTNEMSWMIGDDTGENISAKNPFYCELTAQYWAWKNLKAEYVGLCHYRRYFQKKITKENVDKILGDRYDALCVSPIHERRSVENRLIQATSLEDYQIFLWCLKKLYPDSYETAKSFLIKGRVIAFNMFLMKKSLFDEFAEWQFSILAEMEKYVRLSNYTRGKRIYGYIAEMLLPIFLLWKNKKIKFDDYVSGMGQQPEKPKLYRLQYVYNDIMIKLMRCVLHVDNEAVMVGFRADGIDVGYLEKKL